LGLGEKFFSYHFGSCRPWSRRPPWRGHRRNLFSGTTCWTGLVYLFRWLCLPGPFVEPFSGRSSTRRPRAWHKCPRPLSTTDARDAISLGSARGTSGSVSGPAAGDRGGRDVGWRCADQRRQWRWASENWRLRWEIWRRKKKGGRGAAAAAATAHWVWRCASANAVDKKGQQPTKKGLMIPTYLTE